MALPKAGVELVAEGLSGFVSDMDKASNAVADLGTSAKKASDLWQDAAGRWRNASGQFASDAEKAAAGVETITPAAKGAGEAAKKAGDDAEQGGHGFDVFGEIVTGALRKVGELAVDALLKAGQAVSGFVKDSIGLAGDFQSGMLEFQAVAGKDVDAKGLEKFRDLFITLGKELPVSTSDVEQAAIEMVKGGIDPAIVAAGGLRQNIQFAAAAMGGDLVAAANVSAKILGGWTDASASASDKAAFLTHATDQLTKAANASSVDVHELSLGIFNAQGIAKTAGVSFDDLTTTLAALSPRFASSSEAGNSLKNVIARLQPQTKDATGAMIDLGLITEDGKNKFFDATGSFIGFQKAAELLQGSVAGLSDKQKTLELQMIFGNDAMNAAAGLADLGAAGYQKMADALGTANGVAENAALKQQGYNTALENAKGSVEALQITIGSALLPVLTDLLNNVVAPAVNTLTDMADAVFGNADAFNRLSPAAQTVVDVIKVLVADVQNIIGAFQDAGARSSDFASTIGYLADDLGLQGDLIADIVFAAQDLVGWFGKAGDESDKLGSVVNDLSGIWQKAIGVVQNVGSGYQAIVQSVLPIVSKFINEHGTEISAFFKTAYDQVIRIVNLALDLYNAIVPPILKAIAKYIDDHADQIQTILSGAWDVMEGVVKGALTLIEGTIKIALDLIHGDWQKAWTDLQTMSAKFVTDIGQAIKGGLDIIAAGFGSSLTQIVQVWQHNWDMLVTIAAKVAGQMVKIGADIVAGIQNGIAGAWGNFTSWIHGKIMELPQAVRDALGISSPSTVFATIGQQSLLGYLAGWQSTTPAIVSEVQSIGGKVTESMSPLIDELSSLGEDAMAGFGQGIKDGVRGVIRIVNSASDTVQGAFNDNFKRASPSKWMLDLGQDLMTGWLHGLSDGVPALINLIDQTSIGMINALTKNREAMSEQIRQQAADLIDQAKSLAEDINGAIADGFGATASIDRQLAKNLDKFKDILPQYQQYAAGALQQAEQASRQILDPTQGAKFFQMRSNQIFEFAKLQKDLANAQSAADQDRIKQQMLLINDAQQKEISAFNANLAASQNPIQKIVDAFQQIMSNQNIALPGILDNPIIAQLSSLINQLQHPANNPWVNPPASGAQIGTPYSSNVNYSSTVNMPVYTNQSPAVIQDSAAIAWASMP